MNKAEIRYLKSTEIDTLKWDACLAVSLNGMVYAYSWYLDRVCQHWDALVYGDYLYVMPLVRNKKYRFSYVYQPYFTQQLGIFSAFPVDQEMTNLFLSSIPAEFRLVEMKLNTQNLPSLSAYAIQPNTNYHLDLNQPIATIRKAYHNNTARNLKKASEAGLTTGLIHHVDQFIDFTSHNLSDKAERVKPVHYQNLNQVINYALYHQLGELRGIYDKQNQLVAAAFFLQSNGKIIYLAASSTPEGTEQKAMFLLIDQFLESKVGSELTLDFEGSNIPGVARFYEGFGAKPITYYSVKRNTLPWYAKLIKK